MTLFWGSIFSMIIGTIGHFLYDFTHHNCLIGFIFAKNESVWSHLKLGITPILLWTIVEKFGLINNKYILAINGYTILAFSITIIVTYYFQRLLLKKDYALINIISFYLAIIIAYVTTFLLINIINLSFYIKLSGYLLIILTIFLYLYDSFAKPNYLIFKNPKGIK